MKHMLSRRQWITLGVFALGIALFFLLDGHRQLSLEALRAHRVTLEAGVQAAPVSSAIIYVFVYAVVIALAIPASATLSIVGGFLFGGWWGAALAILGATIGASATFLVVRYVFRSSFEAHTNEKVHRLSRRVANAGFITILMLRALPFIPFSILNVATALVGVRLRDFVLGTAIGIIPETLLFANAGTRLSEIRSFKDIVEFHFLVWGGIFVLVIAIPFFYTLWRDATREKVE